MCGYETGALIIWDIKTGYIMREITDVHSSYVFKCKFWKNDKFNIISSDAKEFVYLTTIVTMFFKYSHDK